MSRPPLLERSLAVVSPVVAGQLHPTRNDSAAARYIAAGSAARMWWQCDAGHEWQAVVKSRTRGRGCPYCAGRLPTEETCLAARHPVVAADWNPDRNGSLTPFDVLPTTRLRVWWRCPRCAWEWLAPVQTRTSGGGCPSCPRDKPRTTLLEGYPQLSSQWDVGRNGALDESVTSGSGRRVWWRCGLDHGWRASVLQRTRGQGCPYCAGKLATPQTSVTATRPQLMTEWAHDLNGDLDPSTVLPTSSVRVWWRCTQAQHVWRVSLRDRGARATGCPFCAGTQVTPEDSLAASHPELAAEWDTERNTPADPTAVGARSHSAVWWRCAAGHCWRARIGDRTTRGSACPTCQDRTVTEQSALAATAPALAAEWDPEKNGQLTAWSVRPFSNRHVWWRCPSGHSWRARISQRSIAHTGCPVCASSARHGQLLTSTRPGVAAQWSELLNAGGPGVVTSGSHVKAWWCCPADPSHLWCAAVRDRLRADTGCPYCAHKLPTPATCLAGAAPHLLSEWHPTRNTTVSPTDLLPQSATPVWWRCAAHHEWRSTPANRLAGHSCPDCAAQRHRRNLPAQPPNQARRDRDAAGHRSE